MSVEAKWYDDCVGRDRPHLRRLSRVPRQQQWEAALHLALALARGEAGWRQIHMEALAGMVEEYWYVPPLDAVIPDDRYHTARPAHTGWWLVPLRVAKRARGLQQAAIVTRCWENGGTSGWQGDLLVLERWARNGHWRQVAARIIATHARCEMERIPRRRAIKRGKNRRPHKDGRIRPARNPRPIPEPAS